MQRHARTALIFMTKWPEPGRAKTRLTPPLSPDQAAALALAFLLDTLAAARTTTADLWLAFAPRRAETAYRALVGPHVGLIEAETADLGIALERAQAATLTMGYQRVALVSSDVPHLPPQIYTDAFAALDHADVALGPSGDGGYYLLAAGRPTPALFRDVAWSTEVVHAQTLERAAAAGLRVATLPTCDDIDTADDLPALLHTLRRAPGAGHTLGVLESLPSLPAPLPV